MDDVFPADAQPADPYCPMSLETINLACQRGYLELFSGVGFTLGPGEALRVAGGNGSGKTSLLRILAGLALPAEGEVRWQGSSIRRKRDEYHAGMVYLGHATGVKDDLLAWENLAMSLTLAGERLSASEAFDALEQAGLDHIADLPGRSLSEGQRKRVALARLALSAHRPLWILDEPFAALDVDAVSSLAEGINRHLSSGGMLVYTTHQDIELQARRHGSLVLPGSSAC
jgi:heme exporter protein A